MVHVFSVRQKEDAEAREESPCARPHVHNALPSSDVAEA